MALLVFLACWLSSQALPLWQNSVYWQGDATTSRTLTCPPGQQIAFGLSISLDALGSTTCSLANYGRCSPGATSCSINGCSPKRPPVAVYNYIWIACDVPANIPAGRTVVVAHGGTNSPVIANCPAQAQSIVFGITIGFSLDFNAGNYGCVVAGNDVCTPGNQSCASTTCPSVNGGYPNEAFVFLVCDAPTSQPPLYALVNQAKAYDFQANGTSASCPVGTMAFGFTMQMTPSGTCCDSAAATCLSGNNQFCSTSPCNTSYCVTDTQYGGDISRTILACQLPTPSPTQAPTILPTTQAPPTTLSPTLAPTTSPTQALTTLSPSQSATTSPTQALTTSPTQAPTTASLMGLQRCITGGRDPSGLSRTTDCYNPSTNTWAIVPRLALPTANYHMAAVNFGGVSCLVGGYQRMSDVLCTNWTSPWIALPALPSPSWAATAVYGANWTAVSGDVMLNVTVPGSWTAVTTSLNLAWVSSSNPAASHWPTAVNLNGTTCLSGGERNSVYLSTSACFVKNTWKSGPTLNKGRNTASSLFINGKWCLAGGWDGTGPMNSIECIDANANFGVTNYTLSRSVLPFPITGAANITINGLDCITGGQYSTATVYCANSSTGNTIQWIPMGALSNVRNLHSSWVLNTEPPISAPTSSPTTKTLTSSGATTGAILGVMISSLLFFLEC